MSNLSERSAELNIRCHTERLETKLYIGGAEREAEIEGKKSRESEKFCMEDEVKRGLLNRQLVSEPQFFTMLHTCAYTIPKIYSISVTVTPPWVHGFFSITLFI